MQQFSYCSNEREMQLVYQLKFKMDMARCIDHYITLVLPSLQTWVERGLVIFMLAHCSYLDAILDGHLRDVVTCDS